MAGHGQRATDGWTIEAELEALGRAVSGEVQSALQECEASARLVAERTRGRLDADTDEHLEFLGAGLARLRRMAEAFAGYARDLSRPVRRERVSLNDLVDEERRRLAERLTEAGGKLERSDLPVVQGDARLVGLLLRELIENALEHRGDSPASIEVGARDGRIYVRDSGPGLGEALASRALEPFATLGGRSRGDHVGLGLYLCRRVVACHGGRLRLESRAGEGTLVSFDLPLARSALAAREAPEGSAQTILAAEDDDAVRHALRVILGRSGFTVLEARNGVEAVERWAEASPDLVLMDVQMPTMDGMDATRAIRKQEKEKGCARTPIVALTAHTGAAERERCLEAGMDAFIPKPFVAIDLLRRLRSQLQGSPGGESEARPAPLLRPSAAGDPVFDRVLALQLCGGDASLLRQVVRLFLRGRQTSMERIRAAVDAGAATELASAAHGLKGTVHSVGGRAASTAAAALEKMGKSGDLTGSRAALDLLEREIERLGPVLERV